MGNVLNTGLTPQPLAGSALSPTNLGSVFGQQLTAPSPLRYSGNLQQDQNQANNANSQRYNLGLSVLGGGVNSGLQSIQDAIASSQNYGQAAQKKLDLQLQQGLGQQQQSAVSRGLGNTTISDTMKDLPQRQYNDASAQVSEMAANRQAGLLLNQANAQNQGANSISNFIASRNDVGPNANLYAALAQKAASNPGQRSISGGFGGGGGAAGAGSGPGPGLDFGSNKLPNSSGGGSSTGGGPGGYFTMGGGSQAPAPISPSQGYQGGTLGGGQAPAGGQDPNFSPGMAAAGMGQGSISITGKGVSPMSTTAQPPSASTQAPTSPAAPTSIAAAAGPQSLYSQGSAGYYAAQAKMGLPEWLKANNAAVV